MMLLKKYNKPELMDDFTIQDERIDLALKELRFINYFLGGNSASKHGISNTITDLGNNRILLLDVGAGSSEILDDFKKTNKAVRVISLDKSKRVCNFIKKKSNFKPIVVCADALKLPFKPKSVDVVHASLFLHHFDDDGIKNILKNISDIAKHGIVINDLRRSLAAFLGIKILTLLFSQSELVKNDAPISVRKGFLKKEIIRLLNEIQFKSYEIKRKWAFRWLITAKM